MNVVHGIMLSFVFTNAHSNTQYCGHFNAKCNKPCFLLNLHLTLVLIFIKGFYWFKPIKIIKTKGLFFEAVVNSDIQPSTKYITSP